MKSYFSALILGRSSIFFIALIKQMSLRRRNKTSTFLFKLSA